jgi:hypothetical protein
MDFSIVLVLPFAALVTFATLLAAAAAKRPRPRLVWPFAFSVIATAPVFIGPPETPVLGYWVLAFILLALWAAFGTIFGLLAAKMVIAAARFLRHR